MSSGGNVGEDILNVATNFLSVGLVGYDGENGGFDMSKGLVTKNATPIIKDITGATAAEEANADARARYEEEKANALREREQALNDNAVRQLQASRSGNSSRSATSTSNSRNGRASMFSDLGGERDFLGL